MFEPHPTIEGLLAEESRFREPAPVATSERSWSGVLAVDAWSEGCGAELLTGRGGCCCACEGDGVIVEAVGSGFDSLASDSACL